jgi:hypothetical protein
MAAIHVEVLDLFGLLAAVATAVPGLIRSGHANPVGDLEIRRRSVRLTSRSNAWLKLCGWIGSPFSFATTRP